MMDCASVWLSILLFGIVIHISALHLTHRMKTSNMLAVHKYYVAGCFAVVCSLSNWFVMNWCARRRHNSTNFVDDYQPLSAFIVCIDISHRPCSSQTLIDAPTFLITSKCPLPDRPRRVIIQSTRFQSEICCSPIFTLIN